MTRQYSDQGITLKCAHAKRPPPQRLCSNGLSGKRYDCASEADESPIALASLTLAFTDWRERDHEIG